MTLLNGQHFGPMKDVCFLIADGDGAYRSLTKDILLPYLHGLAIQPRFFEAETGEEAFTIFDLNRDEITLIFAALNIPGMTGIELLKKVRALDSGIPFILLPDRAEEKHILAARDAGVTACMVKPFSHNELQSKLDRALRLRESPPDNKAGT